MSSYVLALLNRTLPCESLCFSEIPSIKFEGDSKRPMVKSGMPVSIDVRVKGNPKVTWSLDGKDMSKDTDVKLGTEGDKHWLRITKTDSRHAGTYGIKAVNAVGEDNQNITLTVTGKYSINAVNSVKITRIPH